MAARLTIDDFRKDSQGSRFTDVIGDNRVDFQAWVDFFNEPGRQERMIGAELHHDRPALAGVVRELEHHPAFQPYLENYDSHTTRRGRQAIGVIVRIVMEELGWSKTGRKGSLGQRLAVQPGTTTPGAYRNSSGLSRWFTRSERYELPDGMPW